MTNASTIDRHIGNRVRIRRNELNLNQKALADRIGRSFQQIHKYEIGTNRIAASVLYEIAVALDTPVTYFFDGL